MSNFVSYSDATALMSEIGKKKLTVTDVMPLAATAANKGIPYLYLGATTQDFTNGSIYESQEVTPATDPKSYEWVEKYQSSVDLTYYKRIWGGTEAGWEALTDEQKAQYEYNFFDGDSDYTLDTIDAVTDGDMRPVTSNAVYDKTKTINTELVAMQNVYGAKNFLENNLSSYTENGLTITVNADKSITVDGTATADTTIVLTRRYGVSGNKMVLDNGNYIVNGCDGGSNSTYRFELSITQGGIAVNLTNSYDGDTTFVVNGDDSSATSAQVQFMIVVVSGVTLNNKQFNPMIRLASIKDDTYIPYAATNKQLTDAYGLISRRFNIVISNTFGTAELPDDWKTGYRFIYVLMNYGSMDYLLQPTVLPTESLATGRNYAISYNDGTQPYVIKFNIDGTNNTVTLSKIKDVNNSITGAWFCLIR